MIKALAFNKPINISIFIAYTFAVTFLSLKPHIPVDDIPYNDKVAHLLTYLIFTLLAWRIDGWSPAFRKLTITIIVYGGLIEVLQNYTGRMMSFYDLIANTSGVALALLGLFYIEKIKHKIN